MFLRKTAIFLHPIWNLTTPLHSLTPISYKTRELRQFANKLSRHIGLIWLGFRGNRGSAGAILTFNELILTFWGLLVPLCQFWWKSIKKCDRESAHRRTDTRTRTDANWFYNLSMLYAIVIGTDEHPNSDTSLSNLSLILWAWKASVVQVFRSEILFWHVITCTGSSFIWAWKIWWRLVWQTWLHQVFRLVLKLNDTWKHVRCDYVTMRWLNDESSGLSVTRRVLLLTEVMALPSVSLSKIAEVDAIIWSRSQIVWLLCSYLLTV